MNSLNINKTRLEIPTDKIAGDLQLIEHLNQISYKTTKHPGTKVTLWHFDDGHKAIQAILKLQETNLPYRWIEEDTPALIIQYGDEEHF